MTKLGEVYKTPEQRKQEVQAFNPIPQEWREHIKELAELKGNITLANGQVLAEMHPVFVSSKSGKTGKLFQAIQLTKVGGKYYATVAVKGFWAIQARIDLVARPASQVSDYSMQESSVFDIEL